MGCSPLAYRQIAVAFFLVLSTFTGTAQRRVSEHHPLDTITSFWRWSSITSTDARDLRYSDGVMHINAKDGSCNFFPRLASVDPAQDWNAFVTSTMLSAKNNSGVGVVVQSDLQSFTMIVRPHKNTFYLGRYDGLVKKWITYHVNPADLSGHTSSPHIKDVGENNTIGIAKHGDSIDFVINDNVVHTLSI